VLIVSTIQMRVRWEKRREFLQTMADLMALLRGLRGCTSYRFYVNSEDAAAFQLVSEWQNVAQFERHLTSGAFRVFRGSRPLLSSDPQAQLDVVSDRETLDTAQGWTFAH
jgi:quinol monooxygenase YgiN